MKTIIYLLFILLMISCSNKADKQESKQVSETKKNEVAVQEIEPEKTIAQNLLKEFPNYDKELVTKGDLNSDGLTDYFYILSPDYNKEENRRTSRCVLVFGHYKNNKPRKIVFEDLLPKNTLSGKIDYPFETFRLSNDTLFVCFLSSEYGHNEFYMKSYTFRFDNEQNFFSLIRFKYEVSMLPEREDIATLIINENELVNSKLPFSYSNWLYYSPDNVLISKNTIPKWKHFSIELKKIGLEYESKRIEDKLF